MLRLCSKIIRSLETLLRSQGFKSSIVRGLWACFCLHWLAQPLLGAEQERDDLKQSLEQLQQKLEAMRAAEDKDPMGVVSYSADQAFALAEQNLRDREYIATIRNLNQVLNQVPQLDQERYLKAQYMLGCAYEELQQIQRAGKAWLRYLSSYTTQKGDDTVRMIEVIRRLLLVQERLATDQRGQLQRALADITALPLSSEVSAEVHLLAGIAAIHGHEFRLADTWLDKVRRTKSSRRLWAEASFYAGLSAMQQADETKAEKIWLEVAGIADDALIMVRDLAALNLGRLYAARKMPKLSIEWYAKVKAPGAASRMAAYEATLLAAQSENFAEASRFAKSYISSYPTTREAYELQEKLPLILYQAGHLDLAEDDLRRRDQTLSELQTWLEGSTRGRLAINSQDILKVDERIRLYALSSPVMKQSQDLFSRLHSLDRVQQEHRNELRSLMLTLGRVLDPKLRPRVITSNRQLKQIIEQWTRMGELMVRGERTLYQAQLTPAEQLSLDRSLARRHKLRDIGNDFQKGSWRAWQDLSTATLRMGELAQRLQQQQSQLAGIVFNGHDAKSRELLDFGQQGQDYQKRIASLQERSNSLVEQLRLQSLMQTSKDSPYITSRKQLLLNAQEFMEAEAIFDRQRGGYDHPLQRHAQEDFQQAWSGWHQVAAQILTHIKRLDSKEKAWLEAQLQTFDRLNQKSAELRAQQLELERRLAILTGKAWPHVLNHLSYHINEQQARAKKWLADLQWQRSMNQSQKRQDQKKAQDRKETDIQESLKDLELEGALHE